MWVFCIQGAIEARSTVGFYSSPDTGPVIMICLCHSALVLYASIKADVFEIEGETGCGWYSFVAVDEKRWLLYSGTLHHSSSSSSASLFHARLVMPGRRRRCKRVEPHFPVAAPADRLEHVITVFISLLLHFPSLPVHVCVLSNPPNPAPLPAHPVETANRAPALYRQSNPRPTSSRPTSTSCRSSWHVSPNVPASSSPPSTVYRSVLQYSTFKQMYSSPNGNLVHSLMSQVEQKKKGARKQNNTDNIHCSQSHRLERPISASSK